MGGRKYDLVSIGRSGVDLYGDQFGGRLEDMLSFSKYVGGCPANIAIGTSRLGLNVAMITRVGDEQMGRYLIDTFANNGVDTQYIVTDKERLTTLVLLGIQDAETFPLLYYRKHCADMGICEDDMQEDAIANSQAILLSGVHLSSDTTAKACFRAVALAQKHNTKILFDIDYRPTLWGLTGLGGGESRFVENSDVTKHIQQILPQCDLIVGTDEEFNIAGGSTNPLESLRNIREISEAVFVYKMGALGCCVIAGDVPDELTPDGESFSIEVLNSVGAGDAFMSGFLSAYLRGKDWQECATHGNASGALVVTRHGCSPASPSKDELEYFIQNHTRLPSVPDEDPYFKHLHHATTCSRSRSKGGDSMRGEHNAAKNEPWNNLHILAFDHRVQLEAMADDAKIDIKSKEGVAKIKEAKNIIYQAFDKVRAEHSNNSAMQFGLICDDRYGEDILQKSSLTSLWSARPVEKPLARPLDFDFTEDIGVVIKHFQKRHTIKCLIFHHPKDNAELQEKQMHRLNRLYQLCRSAGLELLVEILPPVSTQQGSGLSPDEIVASIELVYKNNVFPDWWKLAAMNTQEGWDKVTSVIDKNDKHCRGLLLLGADKPIDALKEEFVLATKQRICKGYAIGRSIFALACKDWLSGKLDKEEAIDRIYSNFKTIVKNWESCRNENN